MAGSTGRPAGDGDGRSCALRMRKRSSGLDGGPELCPGKE